MTLTEDEKTIIRDMAKLNKVDLAEIAGSDELAREKIAEFCDEFVPQLEDIIVPDHQQALDNAKNKLELYKQYRSA